MRRLGLLGPRQIRQWSSFECLTVQCSQRAHVEFPRLRWFLPVLAQSAERVPWGRLRALQFGANALSVNDRAAIRSALQDAATFDYEVKLNASQALPMARRFGFKPDDKGFREMAPQVWPGGKFTPSICVSIDTPPEEANKSVVIPLAQ